LNNVENINENTENYLDSFMKTAVTNENLNIETYESLFINTMNLLSTLNDDNIFRNTRNLFVPTVYEGVLIALTQNFERFNGETELLRSKIEELKVDVDFRRFSGTASNSKSRIKNRLTRANQIFSE